MIFLKRKSMFLAFYLMGMSSIGMAAGADLDPSYYSSLSRETVLDLIDQATIAVDAARRDRCDVRRAEMLLAEGRQGADEPSWGYARAAYLAHAAMRAIGACQPMTGSAEPAQTIEVATLQESAPSDSFHVSDGDNLWDIAARPEVYGDSRLWPLLYKANVPPIEDADLLTPGQLLIIPREFGETEQRRATRHALNRGSWELGLIESGDQRYLSDDGGE